MEQHEPGFLVHLDAEQRVRYYHWWQKYLLWKRLTQFFTVIAAVNVFVTLVLLPAAPRHVLMYRIAEATRGPAFLIAAGFAIWGSFLDCPRCNQSFRGFGRRYITDECQNCGLTYRELSSIGKPRR